MKKHLLLLLLFQFGCLSVVFAQKERNVWAFSDNAGLDFNSGTPVSVKTGIKTSEGSASVCDANGQLLFYTDGNKVWNRNHNIMPNGTSLTGSMTTASATQSSVIVRMPGNIKKYYIFSMSDIEAGRGGPKLFYSIVDMALNGGLGDIATGYKAILLDSGLTEKLTAVAGNKVNAWVMVRSYTANEYKAFEVTKSGVNRNPVISICGGASRISYVAGEIKFSPNGKKMAAGTYSLASPSELELYDFDPATGLISNVISLDVRNSILRGAYYGVAFSEDNSKLYAGVIAFNSNSYTGVFQFDLSVPQNAIAGTKTQLTNVRSASVKLGPDGKVYIADLYSVALSVINFPNLAGAACQYVNNAVPLVAGTKLDFGLPNEIVIPLDVTVSNIVYYCSNSNGIQLIDSGNGPKTWQVISGPGIISGSGDTVTVTTTANTRVIFIDSLAGRVDTTTIIVPDAKLDAGPDDTIFGCTGFLDTLHATLTDTTPELTYDIAWRQESSILTASNTLQPVIAPLSATTYKITVTTPAAQGECIWEDSVHITTIDRSVHAGFVHTTGYGCKEDTVMFTNTSTGSGILQYKWAFGDGTGTDATNATHIYKTGGQYPVKLYVSNEVCIDSIIKNINSSDPVRVSQDLCDCKVGMPTAFTPNNDGHNDVLRPVIQPGCQLKNFELYIYNRWGQLVYSGRDPLHGWDGKQNGTSCDIGTYMFKAYFTVETESKEHYLMGDITLLK